MSELLVFDGWTAEVRIRTIPRDSIQAKITGAHEFIELEITGSSAGSMITFKLSEATTIAEALSRIACEYAEKGTQS